MTECPGHSSWTSSLSPSLPISYQPVNTIICQQQLPKLDLLSNPMYNHPLDRFSSLKAVSPTLFPILVNTKFNLPNAQAKIFEVILESLLSHIPPTPQLLANPIGVTCKIYLETNHFSSLHHHHPGLSHCHFSWITEVVFRSCPSLSFCSESPL